MARENTNAIEMAIAAGDSERLRKLAARARVAETRMLQMLVADLIDRKKRWRQPEEHSATGHQGMVGAA